MATPTTVQESKNYDKGAGEVWKAVLAAIPALGGKVLSQEAAKGRIDGQMDKKMKGEVLGDRSKVEIAFAATDATSCTVTIRVYPINPVGQKLTFGARPGVAQKVAAHFWDAVDAQL